MATYNLEGIMLWNESSSCTPNFTVGKLIRGHDWTNETLCVPQRSEVELFCAQRATEKVFTESSQTLPQSTIQRRQCYDWLTIHAGMCLKSLTCIYLPLGITHLCNKTSKVMRPVTDIAQRPKEPKQVETRRC